MGVMKRIYQEIQDRRDGITDEEATEMELDFDAMNLQDADWWREQDDEMTRLEREQLEIDAEVFELRQGGLL